MSILWHDAFLYMSICLDIAISLCLAVPAGVLVRPLHLPGDLRVGVHGRGDLIIIIIIIIINIIIIIIIIIIMIIIISSSGRSLIIITTDSLLVGIVCTDMGPALAARAIGGGDRRGWPDGDGALAGRQVPPPPLPQEALGAPWALGSPPGRHNNYYYYYYYY